MLYVLPLILLIIRALRISEQKNISNSRVMSYSQEIVDKLEDLAWDYIQECLHNTKEVVSNKGQIVYVQDRMIPTIDYFLSIWIPLKHDMKLLERRTWYRWLREEGDKSHTIKNIDAEFIGLGKNIVANEGKGIFYAKNKFGMHDRQHIETKQVEKFDFDV